MHDALDIGGAGGQFDLIRIAIEYALHRIAHIERAAHGFRAFVVHGHPQREERRVHAAFLQAHQVGLAVGQAFADVGVLDQHALHGIDVSIDPDDLGLDAPRALGGLISREGATQKEKGLGNKKFVWAR